LSKPPDYLIESVADYVMLRRERGASSACYCTELFNIWKQGSRAPIQNYGSVVDIVTKKQAANRS
jgi:hypothetical protein